MPDEYFHRYVSSPPISRTRRQFDNQLDNDFSTNHQEHPTGGGKFTVHEKRKTDNETALQDKAGLPPPAAEDLSKEALYQQNFAQCPMETLTSMIDVSSSMIRDASC